MLNRNEFREKNSELIAISADSVLANGDGSLNLEHLTNSLKAHMCEKKDIVVYLEYSQEKGKYFFNIYKERK